MNKKIHIYGITDPRNGAIRYIGKAANPKRRLWDHINDAKKGVKTYKHDWIRSLLEKDLKPEFVILEITNEEGWQEAEKKWIAKYSEADARLTNLTEGGDGLIGYHHSEEVKQRIGQASVENGSIPPSWKGRKQSPDHIRKRVEARKRNNSYKHTEEAKEKISQGRKGKALGNTNTLGHKLTEKHKRKIGKALKGRKGKSPSEETRRKISKAKTGRKHTEETKQKMRVSHAKRLGKQRRDNEQPN